MKATGGGRGSRSSTDLSCHRRRAGPIPELEGGRGGVWADAFQVSIRPDQPNRRYLKVWGRDDAGDALRSGSDHAGASSKVVMAQGLGDEHADSEEKHEPASDIDSVMAG